MELVYKAVKSNIYNSYKDFQRQQVWVWRNIEIVICGLIPQKSFCFLVLNLFIRYYWIVPLGLNTDFGQFGHWLLQINIKYLWYFFGGIIKLVTILTADFIPRWFMFIFCENTKQKDFFSILKILKQFANIYYLINSFFYSKRINIFSLLLLYILFKQTLSKKKCK